MVDLGFRRTYLSPPPDSMLLIDEIGSVEISNGDARPYSGQIGHRRKVAQGAAEQLSSGKSCRRPPHKTTETQKRVLLDEFRHNPNPGAPKREQLARLLNVERRIIKNWFSNQRAMRRKMGLRHHDHSSRSMSSSASGSGEEVDDPLERSMEIATGTPRSVESQAGEGGGVISPHRNATPYTCSPPPVLRATTNANSQRLILIDPQPSSRKSPEALMHSTKLSTNLCPSSNFIAPKSSMQYLPPSIVVSPFPLPLDNPYLHPRQTLDQLIVRHGSETHSELVRGYPESALRSSLRVE